MKQMTELKDSQAKQSEAQAKQSRAQATQSEAQAKQIEAIERRLAKQSASCFGCFGGGRTVPDTTDGVRV